MIAGAVIRRSSANKREDSFGTDAAACQTVGNSMNPFHLCDCPNNCLLVSSHARTKYIPFLSVLMHVPNIYPSCQFSCTYQIYTLLVSSHARTKYIPFLSVLMHVPNIHPSCQFSCTYQIYYTLLVSSHARTTYMTVQKLLLLGQKR